MPIINPNQKEMMDAVSACRVLSGEDVQCQKYVARFAGDAVPAISVKGNSFAVKTKDGVFSLSGMENKIRGMIEAGENPADVCRFTLETLASVLKRTTLWARETFGDLPVLCSGGVASNSLIRSRLEPLGAVFAPAQYSTDNALGVAILTHRAMERGAEE